MDSKPPAQGLQTFGAQLTAIWVVCKGNTRHEQEGSWTASRGSSQDVRALLRPLLLPSFSPASIPASLPPCLLSLLLSLMYL